MARGESYQLQGQQGGIVLTTGNSSAGPFRWIQVVTPAVFSALTAPNLADASTKLITVTHAAGSGFGGNITGVTVTSGTVIGYYA